MLSSEVVKQGEHFGEKYPQVKQWQNYNTFALFSTPDDAVILSVDVNHPHDYVGMKVEDTQSKEWIQVKDFKIVITG